MIHADLHPEQNSLSERSLSMRGRFSRARWLGVVLLVIEATILGSLSGSWLFPGVIVLVAVFAGATRVRLSLRVNMRHFLYSLIAIGFVLHYFISPFEIASEDQFIQTTKAHTLARFLICIQLTALVVQSDDGRPPLWLAGVGAMALPFAANIRLSATMQQTLIWWIVAYVAVAALFGSEWRIRVAVTPGRRRWSRSVILFATLCASLLLGSGSALALQRYERNIEWFLGDYLGYRPQAVRPGFTAGGRLNDVLTWKNIHADHISLRAFSAKAPGYLRGQVFDAYRKPKWDRSWTTWTSDRVTHTLLPAKPFRSLPDVGRANSIYKVAGGTDGPWSTIEVWLDGPQGPFVFAPLETDYLAVADGRLASDMHDTISASNRDHSLPYTIIAAHRAPQEPLEEELRRTTTMLDPQIDPQIVRLAADLFAQCRTNREKMDRVQQWFHDHFQYRLGIDVPSGVDPLTFFLTTRSPAHCEYFATGTAVLLRQAGVPSRYVTGFVVTERNTLGGYWLARNKDAHAWVEAYDDIAQQWVIVESTPFSGVPQPRTDSFSSQLTDSVTHYWTVLNLLLQKYGIGGLLLKLWDLTWSIPGLVILILLILVPTLWKSPQLPRRRRRRADPRLKSMHAVLTQLDRKTKRQGLERGSDETLVQFANRIRQWEDDVVGSHLLANCYDLYATLRFRGQTGADAVEQLREAMSHVSNTRHSSTQMPV